MAVNSGTRETRAQLGDNVAERLTLLRSPRVFRCLAIGGNTPDVADADRTRIMPEAVGAGTFDRTSGMYAAIAVYYIMVSYGTESTLPMNAIDVIDSIVTTLGSGCAMDDDFVDITHYVRQVCYVVSYEVSGSHRVRP